MEKLQQLLHKTSRRLSINRSINSACAYAAVLLLFGAGGIVLLWGRVEFGGIYGGLIPGLFLLSWLFRSIKLRVSARAAATVIDRHYETDDLFLNAIAVADDNPFRGWLLAQVQRVSADIVLSELVPFRFPAMLLFYFVATLVFVVALESAPLVERGLDTTVIKVLSSAEKLVEVSKSSALKNPLLVKAAHVGEKFQEGLRMASLGETENLKERFDKALKDDAFRKALLERLSAFGDAQKMQATLESGSGEQVRLAIEQLMRTLGNEDRETIRDAMAAMQEEFAEVKTLLLKLDESDMQSFREKLAEELKKVLPADEYRLLKRSAVIVETLQRDVVKWAEKQTNAGSSIASSNGVADTAGKAVGVDAGEVLRVEDEVRPQAWTKRHWESLKNEALLDPSIEMSRSEKEIVKRYFERD